MKRETLITDFLEKIPDFWKRAEEEADLWRGKAYSKEDSADMFSLFVPSLFFKETLPEIKDRELYKRIFDFFESMATSDDDKVRHILIHSILERLGQYPENLKAVWLLMGEKTRLISDETERRLGRKGDTQ